MKYIILIFTLSFLLACSNNNKLKSEKEKKINDTIVIKKRQSSKEVDYFVSVKNRKSNLKYAFVIGRDEAVVISRNFDFNVPSLPKQESIFNFDEFNYVLKEAKNDFKIDSLKYIIYGTLDSAKNINSVKKITDEYITHKNGKSNISTKDYGKISELILHSDIVEDINKSLFPYSKTVSKISIEKARISKSNRTASEIINCFVVMTIEEKE